MWRTDIPTWRAYVRVCVRVCVRVLGGPTFKKWCVGRANLFRASYFQTSGECRVAVLAITAAGIAITLTAASTVYFAETYWNPGSLIQVTATATVTFIAYCH